MVTFDQKFARLLLEICRYTYAKSFDDAANKEDEKNALDWINKAGTPDALVILNDGGNPSTSVACVVAYPDKNIVSYMGTKTGFSTPEEAIASMTDWYKNIKVKLEPFKLTTEQLGLDHPDKGNLGGLVHNGFLGELSAVQEKVVQELLKHGGRDRPVYVTGHSQGGAVATLATRALLIGGFSVVATYTFAAPRPGDQAFADTIPATLPVHRIEFGDDIVPHVPPTLVGRNILMFVNGLLNTPLLPKRAENILNRLKNTTENFSFVGVGKLCYGNHDMKELHVDIPANQEKEKFNERLRRLAFNHEHWTEHHHLAGTSAEVSRGVKGNYTALVSDFPMVS